MEEDDELFNHKTRNMLYNADYINVGLKSQLRLVAPVPVTCSHSACDFFSHCNFFQSTFTNTNNVLFIYIYMAATHKHKINSFV